MVKKVKETKEEEKGKGKKVTKKKVQVKAKEPKVEKTKKEKKAVKEPKVVVEEVTKESVVEEIKPAQVEEVKTEEEKPAEVKIEGPKEVTDKPKPLKKGFITGTGRRKEAKAGVFLWQEKGEFIVNGMAIEKYFSGEVEQTKWVRPFFAIGVSHPEAKFSASVKVRGSGKSSQLDAVILGFARALAKLDPEFDKTLRKLGFMTRDSRMVERKKYYLHKARKRPQYSKR